MPTEITPAQPKPSSQSMTSSKHLHSRQTLEQEIQHRLAVFARAEALSFASTISTPESAVRVAPHPQ